MLFFKSALMSVGFLVLPFVAQAQSHESVCNRIVRTHGGDSAIFNDGVKRPSPRAWEIVDINKPWFGDTEIEYTYSQTTSDGFRHDFKCELTSAGWYGKVWVEGYGYAIACGEGVSERC